MASSTKYRCGRMVRHYIAQPVDGLILAATTGEASPSTRETERLVFTVRDEVGNNGAAGLPGLGGSNTAHCWIRWIARAAWPIDGYLISCPYYSRPSQHGLERHFGALAESRRPSGAALQHPYRTGVISATRALLRLAGHPNIVGLKGLLGGPKPVTRSAGARPAGLAVLTGEDRSMSGGLSEAPTGGILASRMSKPKFSPGLQGDEGGGARCGAVALAVGCRSCPVAVRRTEPGADQALAVAHGTNRSAEVRLR